MKDFDFFLPTKIVFGSGKLSKIGDYVKPLGKKAALISDKPLAELGVVARVKEYLKGNKIEAVEFTGVRANPISTMINEVARSLKGERIDFVVGVGGGSPIDFAKGLGVAIVHGDDIWNYVTVGGKIGLPVTSETLPIVAVATTSGTGSEVTPFSILTNPTTSEKCAIISEHVFPRIALIDPRLTLTVPRRLTASTAIDALSHAIESYINKDAQSFTEMTAIEAMKLISTNLLTAVIDGNNLEARSKMAWAATLGGIAISNGNVTLAHAIGHPMSGRFDIPHGEAIALGLPAVMRHSWMWDREKFAMIANAMGADDRRLSLEARAKRSVEAVEKLLVEIDLKLRLRDYSVDDSDLDGLAKDATGYMVGCLEAHPRAFGLEEVREIYREIL